MCFCRQHESDAQTMTSKFITECFDLIGVALGNNTLQLCVVEIPIVAGGAFSMCSFGSWQFKFFGQTEAFREVAKIFPKRFVSQYRVGDDLSVDRVEVERFALWAKPGPPHKAIKGGAIILAAVVPEIQRDFTIPGISNDRDLAVGVEVLWIHKAPNFSGRHMIVE